jgi:hypothetical protein
MRDLLRDRPVQMARVAARYHRSVQLDLERYVERPGRLAQVGQRLGVLPRRVHAKVLELG